MDTNAASTTLRVHICASCEIPINTYGRIQPCYHAFCLRCASAMSKCIICLQAVGSIERISLQQGLFVSPVTLQSFTSGAEIEDHVTAIRNKLSGQ